MGSPLARASGEPKHFITFNKPVLFLLPTFLFFLLLEDLFGVAGNQICQIRWKMLSYLFFPFSGKNLRTRPRKVPKRLPKKNRQSRNISYFLEWGLVFFSIHAPQAKTNKLRLVQFNIIESVLTLINNNGRLSKIKDKIRSKFSAWLRS